MKSTRKHISFVRILLTFNILTVFLPTIIVSQHCPGQCYCLRNRHFVNCISDGLDPIPESFPKNVTHLYLKGYKIGRLKKEYIQEMRKLTVLHLEDNEISSIEDGCFSQFLKLQRLDLSKNDLDSINSGMFLGQMGLIILDLSKNNIKNIMYGFMDLIMVHHLNLYHNRVNELKKDTFIGLTNIRTLNLDFNNISKIHSATFKYLTRLESLILSNNPLKSISILEFHATKLQHIYLSGMRFKDIPSAFPANIKEMRLNHNNLTEIKKKDFKNYPMLEFIVLDDNQITRIENNALGDHEHVERIWIDRNRLTEIPYQLPSSLLKLYLEYNFITSITSTSLAYLGKLKHLSLKGNNIQIIGEHSLSNLKRLTKLDLESNKIISIHSQAFCNLKNLTSLYLSSNKIQSIDGTLFQQQNKLNSLRMAKIRNDIQIDENAFEGVKVLKSFSAFKSPKLVEKILKSDKLLIGIGNIYEMNIMNNNLTTLRDDFPSFFPNLNVIALNGNQWHCNKMMMWLRDWIRYTRIHFSDMNSLYCSTPEFLSKTLIIELNNQSFVPKPPATVLPLPPENVPGWFQITYAPRLRGLPSNLINAYKKKFQNLINQNHTDVNNRTTTNEKFIPLKDTTENPEISSTVQITKDYKVKIYNRSMRNEENSMTITTQSTNITQGSDTSLMTTRHQMNIKELTNATSRKMDWINDTRAFTKSMEQNQIESNTTQNYLVPGSIYDKNLKTDEEVKTTLSEKTTHNDTYNFSKKNYENKKIETTISNEKTINDEASSTRFTATAKDISTKLSVRLFNETSSNDTLTKLEPAYTFTSKSMDDKEYLTDGHLNQVEIQKTTKEVNIKPNFISNETSSIDMQTKLAYTSNSKSMDTMKSSTDGQLKEIENKSTTKEVNTKPNFSFNETSSIDMQTTLELEYTSNSKSMGTMKPSTDGQLKEIEIKSTTKEVSTKPSFRLLNRTKSTNNEQTKLRQAYTSTEKLMGIITPLTNGRLKQIEIQSTTKKVNAKPTFQLNSETTTPVVTQRELELTYASTLNFMDNKEPLTEVHSKQVEIQSTTEETNKKRKKEFELVSISTIISTTKRNLYEKENLTYATTSSSTGKIKETSSEDEPTYTEVLNHITKNEPDFTGINNHTTENSSNKSAFTTPTAHNQSTVTLSNVTDTESENSIPKIEDSSTSPKVLQNFTEVLINANNFGNGDLNAASSSNVQSNDAKLKIALAFASCLIAISILAIFVLLRIRKKQKKRPNIQLLLKSGLSRQNSWKENLKSMDYNKNQQETFFQEMTNKLYFVLTEHEHEAKAYPT